MDMIGYLEYILHETYISYITRMSHECPGEVSLSNSFGAKERVLRLGAPKEL